MEAAQKHCILPWKGLDFRAPGQQNPSKIDFQTHKNVKVGAKSSRETSREAVETDFGPKITALEAKRAILEAKMEVPYFT